MEIVKIIVIAVGVSMDAFAVSICKGLSTGKATNKQALVTGAWFGGFQALMPFIGFLLGSAFTTFVTSVDHWIAFVLLGIIGLNMIREAREEECVAPDFSPKAMFPLAVATSIDALAVGITLAFLNSNIYVSIIIIGITTFLFSLVGVKLGAKLGSKFKTTAEIIGGLVLICMGIEIVLEHLGII